ncbi:MAG: inositol monophosphatase [Candidatus Micrarchaeota archaeon]
MNFTKRDFKALERVCVQAVLAGGRISHKYFGKIGHTLKGNGDYDAGTVVTRADREAETAIRKIIRKHYPSHSIVGEEQGGKEGKGLTWFIDPLDGTFNYSRGLEFHGSMVAVCLDGTPVAGAVFMPELKKLYYASKGNGAFLNGKRIRVSKNEDLKKSLAIIPAGPKGYNSSMGLYLKLVRHLAPKVVAAVSYINAAMICRIAEGSIDLSISLSLYPWDFCPPAIIVMEAGGVVSDEKGGKWTTEKRNFVAASNKKILRQALALLKK